MNEIVSKKLILKIVKKETDVIDLLSEDKNTEIYINMLNEEEILQINKKYPSLLGKNHPNIYSVNVISSKMSGKKGYKKIRYYFAPEGEIIKKIINF